MKIALIAAMDSKGVIGKNGKVPWKYRSDLNYFRTTTTGHTVIMGRTTYESIGKPLVNRENIVLTRQLTLEYVALQKTYPNLHFVVEKDTALALAQMLEKDLNHPAGPAIFVIGGHQIYNLFMPDANMMHLTEIERNFGGDTFFPDFDRDRWRELMRSKSNNGDPLEFCLNIRVIPEEQSLDRLKKWKEANPRHWWALQQVKHEDVYEEYLQVIVAMGELPDHMHEKLWKYAGILETENRKCTGS